MDESGLCEYMTICGNLACGQCVQPHVVFCILTITIIKSYYNDFDLNVCLVIWRRGDVLNFPIVNYIRTV